VIPMHINSDQAASVSKMYSDFMSMDGDPR
jgi:hypothetical protein